MLTAAPPRGVCDALAALRAAGFQAVLVGGCLRDLLLGRTPHDWDVATAATPDEVARVFADHRLIETGLRHGTVTMVQDGLPVEITSFRRDGAYSDGRRPDEVAFSRCLEDDLARRDFTINAMALDERDRLIDPFGGRDDLARRRLRCVGEPARRFGEDRLRMLRGLRFSAQLGFAIEAQTGAALRELAPALRQLSAERVCSELTLLLTADNPEPVLLEWGEVLAVVLPELAPLVGLAQREDYHCYDVYEHTARAVAAVPADPALRWALLLHDVGKAVCADGQGHFHGHAAASAELADTILRRLRASNALREEVVKLVRLHQLPLSAERGLLRRRLAQHGADFLRRLLLVQRADAAALRADVAAARVAALDETAQALEALCAETPALTRAALAIDGNDLLALGVQSGPALGRLLDELLAAVVAERLPNERASLMGWTKKKLIVES